MRWLENEKISEVAIYKNLARTAVAEWKDEKAYLGLDSSSPSTRTDYEELPEIQKRLSERQCQPGEHYVDAGYMSGPNLACSQENDIDLKGPLPSAPTPQDKIPGGITQAQFQIDVQNNLVTCPEGFVAGKPTPVGNSLKFQFPARVCSGCKLRSLCCTGKDGRTIGVSAHYDLVQATRKRQTTEAFKKDYHKHRSGVEGSPSASVRGNGLRVGRYIGQKKRHLQAVFTGCAVNIIRTANWLTGKRPQVRHKGWGLFIA